MNLTVDMTMEGLSYTELIMQRSLCRDLWELCCSLSICL